MEEKTVCRLYDDQQWRVIRIVEKSGLSESEVYKIL